MYKGLKKKYTREEYVTLTLIKNEDRCYFCFHNIGNYKISYTNKMDVAAVGYHSDKCSRCTQGGGEILYWYEDNFRTLYDGE